MHRSFEINGDLILKIFEKIIQSSRDTPKEEKVQYLKLEFKVNEFMTGTAFGNSTIPYYLIQGMITFEKTIVVVKRQHVCPIYNITNNLDNVK